MRQIKTTVSVILLLALTSAADMARAAGESDLTSALSRHKEPAWNLAPWPELTASSGRAFRADSAVYFAFDSWPSAGKLVFPRLNNPTRKIYLLGKPDTELAIRPEVKEWVVTLPKGQPAGAERIVVLQTIGRATTTTPALIRPDDKGLVILPAHKAVTHGEKLRYEPQPHKNTVGYWTNPQDFAEWIIEGLAAGEYDVYVLQGCGKGQGGSDVSVHVHPLGSKAPPPTSVAFVVQETGHFQNFVRRRIGSLSVGQAGMHAVVIRPDRLANKAVMDVREVRLVPR